MVTIRAATAALRRTQGSFPGQKRVLPPRKPAQGIPPRAIESVVK
jgi:hypothetical protein